MSAGYTEAKTGQGVVAFLSDNYNCR
jgi:hypothetical protein